MPHSGHGKTEVALPLIARALCEKALYIAHDFKQESGADNIEDIGKQFIETAFGDVDNLPMEALSNLPFDVFNIFSYDPAELGAERFLEQLGIDKDNAIPLVETMLDGGYEKNLVQSAAILEALIQMIYEIEQDYVSRNMSYDEFMQTVDPLILSLHGICMAFTTMPEATRDLAADVKRRRGARQGGQAKAKRQDELKDAVLTEARALHADKPATKAATAIHSKLRETGNWLVDDDGKPILNDPVSRFTAWIRQDRS